MSARGREGIDVHRTDVEMKVQCGSRSRCGKK